MIRVRNTNSRAVRFSVWNTIEQFEHEEILRCRDLAAQMRHREAEQCRGRAHGARHALAVIEKAERGWYDDASIAGELRYLASMYRRHARAGMVGRDFEIDAKADALEWASKVAACSFGGDRPYCAVR